jgi:hypothetical protein
MTFSVGTEVSTAVCIPAVVAILFLKANYDYFNLQDFDGS